MHIISPNPASAGDALQLQHYHIRFDIMLQNFINFCFCLSSVCDMMALTNGIDFKYLVFAGFSLSEIYQIEFPANPHLECRPDGGQGEWIHGPNSVQKGRY